jgi:hypothetical protein
VINHFATNAINKAVKLYYEQKPGGIRKYMVIIVNLSKMNKTAGEFEVSYIDMTKVSDYERFQPSHYILYSIVKNRRA